MYSPSSMRSTGEQRNYQSESYHREYYSSNADLSRRYPSVGLTNSPRTLSPAPIRRTPRDYTVTYNEPARSTENYYETSRPTTAMQPTRAYSQDDLRREDHFGSRRTLVVDPDEEIIVKSTDLASLQEQEVIDLVRRAFRKYDITNQRELAGFLKRSADQRFSSCWHCIVGRQFSSYVTHEMNGFIYMTRGPLSILLFKSGP